MESHHAADDALAGRREAVLRRWLGIEVGRASADDLASVSMSERLGRLEVMFEAAVEELFAAGQPHEPGVRDAVEAMVAERLPFALVIVDGGPEARPMLAESMEGASVALDARDGRTAVLLPGVGPSTAPVVADRLRVTAWTCDGADGLLPEAGVAVYPDDSEFAEDLLALAHERLERAGVTEAADPATVTPIHRAV